MIQIILLYVNFGCKIRFLVNGVIYVDIYHSTLVDDFVCMYCSLGFIGFLNSPNGVNKIGIHIIIGIMDCIIRMFVLFLFKSFFIFHLLHYGIIISWCHIIIIIIVTFYIDVLIIIIKFWGIPFFGIKGNIINPFYLRTFINQLVIFIIKSDYFWLDLSSL